MALRADPVRVRIHGTPACDRVDGVGRLDTGQRGLPGLLPREPEECRMKRSHRFQVLLAVSVPFGAATVQVVIAQLEIADQRRVKPQARGPLDQTVEPLVVPSNRCLIVIIRDPGGNTPSKQPPLAEQHGLGSNMP